MEHGVVRSLFNILPTRRLRRLARSRLGLDIRHAHSREFDFVPYEMNTKYTRRLLHFERLLQRIERVDGRIIECGVGPGRSIFAFSVISESLGRPREIWGYDTFEGMPPPQEQDGPENAHKGGWWSYSREHVRELLRFSGLDESFIRDGITFVPGDLRETLPTYDGGPIALLHLDVDFYASYKCALEFLYPPTCRRAGLLRSTSMAAQPGSGPRERSTSSFPNGRSGSSSLRLSTCTML